jgi:hypothetical protein
MRTITRIALVVVAMALSVPLAAFAAGQPLKGTDGGIWGIGSEDCGGLVPVFVTTTGTGTQLGRYAYSSQECVDLAAGTYAGSFTITSGGTLEGTYTGTFWVDGGGSIHYQQTNTITGGTGRFAGASGSFTVDGLARPDGACLQRISGDGI